MTITEIALSGSIVALTLIALLTFLFDALEYLRRRYGP